jgi:hypothetical protein
MERSKVRDKRSVKLEGVLRPDFILFKGGRPARGTVIGDEDILNLRIALNTARSLEEFLKLV